MHQKLLSRHSKLFYLFNSLDFERDLLLFDLDKDRFLSLDLERDLLLFLLRALLLSLEWERALFLSLERERDFLSLECVLLSPERERDFLLSLERERDLPFPLERECELIGLRDLLEYFLLLAACGDDPLRLLSRSRELDRLDLFLFLEWLRLR